MEHQQPGRKKKNDLELRNPWLVAAWPGMGHVAANAVSYLADALQAEFVGEIPGHPFFTVDHVEVTGGVARPGRLPRNLFLAWRDPRGERDLLLFIGEAQPTSRAGLLSKRVMDFARAQGVERVVTFAALGTKIKPTQPPRVFGAVTAPALLDDLHLHETEALPKGQVGGLNGALLSVAAARGIDAMCLLGEMPFYAAGVPNPKASLEVLRAFSALSDIWIELSDLEEAASESEDRLSQLQRQLEDQASRLLQRNDAIFEGGDDEDLGDEPGLDTEEPKYLDPESRRLIETLFSAAETDRSQANELKKTLDQLGAFDEYEDRFLDLFRQ